MPRARSEAWGRPAAGATDVGPRGHAACGPASHGSPPSRPVSPPTGHQSILSATLTAKSTATLLSSPAALLGSTASLLSSSSPFLNSVSTKAKLGFSIDSIGTAK